MGTEETKFKLGEIVWANHGFPELGPRLWILVSKKKHPYTWDAVYLQDPSQTCTWHETFLCKL